MIRVATLTLTLLLLLLLTLPFLGTAGADDKDKAMIAKLVNLAGPWTALYSRQFYPFYVPINKGPKDVSCRDTFFGRTCCVPFRSPVVGDLQLCMRAGNLDIHVMAGSRDLTVCRASSLHQFSWKLPGKGDRITVDQGPQELVCRDGTRIFRPAWVE